MLIDPTPVRRSVLLDLDGTLIDSAPLHTLAFSMAVKVWWKECDVPTETYLTTQQKMDQIGVPDDLRDRIQIITRMLTMDLIPIMVKPDKRLIGEMTDLSKDFQLGVVTNARSAPAIAMLRAMGVWPLIGWLVTAEDGKQKPSPDLYLVAKSRLPNECHVVAVEDSDSGVEAATSAKIACLRVKGPQDITAEAIRDFCGHD